VKRTSEVDGYVLLNKASGETSFQSLSLVKKAFSTGRVGHTGTLDKFARGLLVVMVGRATKLVQYFSGCDKCYEGVIRFGAETDTLDPEGEVVARAPLPSREALDAALPSFLGPIMQAPPLYSAVHVDGRRAHELARSGEVVEMKQRPVTIHDFRILDFDGERARVSVHCSKGTYIRSLARDLALAVGSRGYLEALFRSEVGGFSASMALSPADSEDPQSAVAAALRPVDLFSFRALGYPCYAADVNAAMDLRNGRPIQPGRLRLLGDTLPDGALAGDTLASVAADSGPVAVFAEDSRFLALLDRQGSSWRYGCVYDRH